MSGGERGPGEGQRVGGRAVKRLGVIMFTDMVGSVALQQRLGTEAYAEVIAKHDRMFQRALADSDDGEILSHTGDGMMMRFSDPSDAVETALRLQFLAGKTFVEGEPFRIRVGMHLGMITEMADKVGGDPRLVGMVLNLAARVMDSGDAGQILVTRAIFDDARQCVRVHPPVEEWIDVPRVVWMVHGDYRFKGSDEPLAIFEVGAEGIAPLTAPGDGAKCQKIEGTGSTEVLPSLPAPPSARAPVPLDAGSGKEDAEDLEKQREEFERAQEELKAEIERLRRSEEERQQEIKREAEALARDRARVESMAEELAAKRQEEEAVAKRLLEQAQNEIREAAARSESSSAELRAQKEAFESELGLKAEALERSAGERLADLESREKELLEREGQLEAEKDSELQRERERLELERKAFLEDTDGVRKRIEEERRAFARAQEAERAALEAERRRAAERAKGEAAERERQHAEALEQLRQALEGQEAELQRQREELAESEERIAVMREADRRRAAPSGSLVKQLDEEAEGFATKIDELNAALEQSRQQQKRRLVGIAIGSVVLALVVGIVSAKLIWGIYPWKLLAPEVQPNLVLENLRRLEASGDWNGLLEATLPAADELGESPAELEEVVSFARVAVQKLATPPTREIGEGGERLAAILKQVESRGWTLPAEAGFLSSRIAISRVAASERFAGVGAAIGSYLEYLEKPADAGHSEMLERELNRLFGQIAVAVDGGQPLADEDAIQSALASFPARGDEGIRSLPLLAGTLAIRDQLRASPAGLAEALVALRGLAKSGWQEELVGVFGEVLKAIDKGTGELPSPDELRDLGLRWNDPRPFVLALERLPTGGGRSRALNDLLVLFEKREKAGGGEAEIPFSDDAQAWVALEFLKGGQDAFFGSKEEQEARGEMMLTRLAEGGSAKAKYFLVGVWHELLRGFINRGGETSEAEFLEWIKLAEEAVDGGEDGALLLLGHLHFCLVTVSGTDDDESKAKSQELIGLARTHYAEARSRCPEPEDRKEATIYLGFTWSVMQPRAEEYGDCARELFAAGCLFWEDGNAGSASRFWDSAWGADAPATRLVLGERIESEKSTGNEDLAAALAKWLREKE